MTISKLPPFFDMVYSNVKDGHLSPDGYLYNDQLFQTLNALLFMYNSGASTLLQNNNALVAVGITAPALLGINPPSFTTAQIAAILAYTPPVPNGTMWYNSTLKKLQFKADTGIIETITSV